MNKRPMLFDARSITIKPCGVRNVAENYLAEFVDQFDVTVIANENAVDLLPSGVQKIITAGRFTSRFGPWSDLWVSLQVLKCKPKVFFSAHSFLPVFAILPKQRAFICHDLFAALDKDFFRKKGKLAPLASAYFRFLSELSFFRASLVITPTDAIKETFKGLWAKARRVVVVHNGIRLRPTEELSAQRSQQMLFVGNFRTYKGFDVLMAAWECFGKRPEGGGWVLHVVTNEPQESVDQLVREHGDALHNVTFHSRVCNDELDRLRQTSSVCIVPSRQEGFGIPLLESLGSGAKVVCSDIPVFKELTGDFDQQAILTFTSGDSDSLECALVDVVSAFAQDNCETVLAQAREHNVKVLNERYSWAASANKVISQLQ